MKKPGRKPVLNATKRREIIAILSVGCSRRTAARYVGCATSTIQNTALRNATFARELRRAGEAAEINCLRNIQNAAKKEQYWRAAAWALERCRPEQYAARRADCVTMDQVRDLLAALAGIVHEEVRNVRVRKVILKRLATLLQGLCLFQTPKRASRPRARGEENQTNG
ncbi:MAG TPA: hypothetical protein VJL29_16350 [Thermoguttaceae bacterium]|nr:hypothetical protein [Thermoguttaceae bacterium]